MRIALIQMTVTADKAGNLQTACEKLREAAAYGADIALARKTAVETITAIPGVLLEPAPMAEVLGLNDSSVALTVRAWVKTADYWNVFFAGNRLIKEAFNKAGVEIPFPQLDVRVVSRA